jgi:glutathione S-transferase
MRQLHYFPGNASMAPHIVLREIGEPFELVIVDREHDAHKSAAYLRLNPNGLIPVFVEGELVLYESAAICMHLGDSAPRAGLIPPVGSAARAHCYKWLIWLTNTMQPALLAYFYPERWVDTGDDATAQVVKAHAETRIGAMLAQLDAELARHGGPWLLGAQYSVADPFCMMLCRWTRGFASLPARDWPHLRPYLQRVLERPAVQSALAAEKLEPPWV